MTARDNEAAMLECCALIATGALGSPRTPAEANVCRVAGMILGRHLHDARQRLSQAADAYFAVHPSELLESAETVRRGWIINLPRLRDRLERRLREVGPGEEGQQTTLDAIAELESGNGQSLTTVDALFADLQANDGNAGLQPILVIDLEATCDEGDGLPTMDMEIIEIGAVWATAEGTVLDQFQALVRPVVWPQLTQFCRQLTNIQQADVDGAELFPAVAARLASFAQRHQAPGATWGSWGQFDAKQLARDCERHGIDSPLAAFEHVNLKRRFAKARKIKEVGMARALQMVGLPLDGAHHRGLDDARNIAKLLPWSI